MKALEGIEEPEPSLRKQSIDLCGKRPLVHAELRDIARYFPRFDFSRLQPKRGQPDILQFPNASQTGTGPRETSLLDLFKNHPLCLRVQNREDDLFRLKP